MAASISWRWKALLLATAFAATCTTTAGAIAAGPPIDPPRPPGPVLEPLPRRCSSITSFSPVSARPGEQVDISIAPGPVGLASHITGVTFADNVPASAITVVTYSRVRATVPLAASAGRLRITCRSVVGGTFTAQSTTDFTPIPFGLTVTPASATRQLGQSVTITATLSRPAPEPVPLSIAPSSNALAVGSQPPGQPLNVTVPTGQQSIAFAVTAHRAGAPTATVSGHNIAPATITVNVPTPWFSITGTVADADVHWGESASYAVTVQSGNGFSGPVTLTAENLPDGATAAPVVITVPADGTVTGTLIVSTERGGTPLDQHTIRVHATSPGYPDQTRTPRLRVLPAEDTLVPITDWRSSDSVCGGGIEATFNSNRVTFSGPDVPNNTSFDALMYAFTNDGGTCRGAVVLGPNNTAKIVNLGFDNAIAARPGSDRDLGAYAWDQTQFQASPDASHVIAVSATTTYHATLHNMLDQFPIAGNMQYALNATLSAEVIGATVVGTRSVNGAPAGSPHIWTL